MLDTVKIHCKNKVCYITHYFYISGHSSCYISCMFPLITYNSYCWYKPYTCPALPNPLFLYFRSLFMLYQLHVSTDHIAIAGISPTHVILIVLLITSRVSNQFSSQSIIGRNISYRRVEVVLSQTMAKG